MSYVVIHHWIYIYIYCIYVMSELGLVLEYVQHGQFCNLLLCYHVQYTILYFTFWFL